MIPPRKGKALRAILFRFFRWPFAVGWSPHTSEPAWELSLHLGPRSPSPKDLRRVLRIVPDLEPELVDDLRQLIAGLAAGRERVARDGRMNDSEHGRRLAQEAVQMNDSEHGRRPAQEAVQMSLRVLVSLTSVRVELDGIAREVAEGHVRLPALAGQWTLHPDGVLEASR